MKDTRIGGLRQAAKILSLLDAEKRAVVWALIAQKDPEIAELLKKHTLLFEDLKKLPVKQLQELLQEVSPNKMALALRAAPRETTAHLLSQVSSRIRGEMEEIILGPPQKRQDVLKAQEEILDIVREKIHKGQFLLREEDEEFV